MDLQPRGYEKVVRLIEKGATVPNPFSLDIGDEVDLDRVSGKGVTIYPGLPHLRGQDRHLGGVQSGR